MALERFNFNLYWVNSSQDTHCYRENGFALFNGKVNTSEKECYQVSSSEVGWDKHTVINMWGMDIDNLVPDLSSASQISKFMEPSSELIVLGAYSSQGKPIGTGWWPYSDENGNTKENSTCNALKGTDGAQFPPDVKKSDTLWVFNTLPCRSLYFNYVDTEKIEGSLHNITYSCALADNFH